MKKKHRDIVVDDVMYGWMVECWGPYHVKIWKDKKIIAQYDIETHYDAITPKMIAGLIKDPEYTLEWLNAEPCPFCGKLVEPSDNGKFFVCLHKDDCWLSTTIIENQELETWNRRN